MTARWDVARRRFVVASGRRGVLTGSDLLERQPSSVELVEPVGAVATASGTRRRDRGAPRPAAWSGTAGPPRQPSPSTYASTCGPAPSRSWRRCSTPGPGPRPPAASCCVRPAVLAADVAPADTSVRLLAPAEPAARTTIALLDMIDAAVVDRRTGRAARLSGRRPGAGRRADARRRDSAPTSTSSSCRPYRSPGRRRARRPTGTPRPSACRCRPAPPGTPLRVLTLLGQGRTALRLDVAFVGGGAELRASAMRADAGSFVPVTATISSAALASGIDVHVVARLPPRDAGDRRRRRAGRRRAGSRRLVPRWAGRACGSSSAHRTAQPDNPADVVVRHVHLHGAPVGPPDPRLRLAAAPASAWSPGDPFVLARSTDGVTTVGDGVSASVVGVQGDTVLLDRPVQAAFPRAGSIAYRRSEFFSQRMLRRSDDLMNQLYRICAEYRVSTVLDELDGGVTAPLAEIVDIAGARLRATGRRARRTPANRSSAAGRPRAPPAPRPSSRPTRLNPRDQHPKHRPNNTRPDGGVPWLNA